jgi:4-diphosphocytidyl-2-C-methyl-D-erythritol kinase
MVKFPSAKINLGLYVTDKREDGYHNIETCFYPIGFSDVLEVVPKRGVKPGTIELMLSGLPVEGSPDTNLVSKAYHLVHSMFELPGVVTCLHKCIPTGAGLGGGSADGAAMLMILDELFDIQLGYDTLAWLALQLGSDCPFFLAPEPSFARGRGEELTRAAVSLKGMYLQLYHPGAGIATSGAYRQVEIARPVVSLEQLTSRPVKEWKEFVGNAFEGYAFGQMPVIRHIKETLYESGAVYAAMTGSGSAVYGLFDHKAEPPRVLSDYLIWEELL